MELSQVQQHEFDLGIRDSQEGGYEDICRDLFVAYGELINPDEKMNRDEALPEFEKRLAILLTEVAYLRGMLNEMNFSEVDPIDAAALLTNNCIPSDEILDKVAAIRGNFDEAAEDYANELANVEGFTLGSNVDDDPEKARARLSRFVIASVLVDDREENEI